MNSKKKITFETQLDALEAIVNHLDQGDLSLDDSLSQFEKGVKLTQECQKMLNQAEQKVMILNEGDSQLSDFE